jgi:hypothetical protein
LLSMTVYLVPVGRGRFEAYSETQDDGTPPDLRHEGVIRRSVHRAGLRWQELVERARHGAATGGLARARDAIISRLAESIAEQRTLWGLRDKRAAVVRYPATMDTDGARSALMALLAHARSHHLRWLVVDGVLLLVSGVLALVPGPNILAYYLAFRVIGHVQSWRGARQAMDRVRWTFEADPELAELASLADVPRDARASRVEAIAERLNLPRLSAFFDRVAVRSS